MWSISIQKGRPEIKGKVKKALCYQKLFRPFTVWILNELFWWSQIFANSQPSASNFKSFSRSLEQFFLTVGQNNFGNEIPFLIRILCFYYSTDMNNIATSKKISFQSDRFIQKMDNIVSCPRQELSLTFLQSTIFLWSQQFWPWSLPQTFFSCLQVFFFSVIVARQLLSSLACWKKKCQLLLLNQPKRWCKIAQRGHKIPIPDFNAF